MPQKPLYYRSDDVLQQASKATREIDWYERLGLWCSVKKIEKEAAPLPFWLAYLARQKVGFGAKPQIEIKNTSYRTFPVVRQEEGSGVLSRIKIITFPLTLTNLL